MSRLKLTMKVKDLTLTQINNFFTALIANSGLLPYLSDVGDVNLGYRFRNIYYGEKYILPNIVDIITDSDDVLDFAEYIAKENKVKWVRFAQAYLAEYTPLTDYKKTELHVGNDSHTDEEKVNTDMETVIDQTVASKFYGFNSSDAVPVSDTDTDATNTQTGLKASNTKDFTRTGSNSYTNTISGYNENPVDLLKKEYNARKQNFLEWLLLDVSNYICVQVY